MTGGREVGMSGGIGGKGGRTCCVGLTCTLACDRSNTLAR